MALRELLISLGVEVRGREKVTDLETGLDRVINRAKTLAEAMAALTIVGGIKNIITDTIEAGRKITDMSNVLGVATEDLQAFQFAANMVGASTELAGRSLRYLNRQLGLASEGNKAASKDFHELGIKIKDSHGELRPMMDILEDVADSFQKLKNDPERTAFAVKTFGRAGAGLVPILKGGREGIRGLREEFERLGGGLHEDFLREAKEADRGLTRLALSFEMMKSRIVLGVLPAFETMVGWLQRALRAFGDLADKTYFAQTALAALAAVAMVLFAPLLLEILPIVAAVGALYLVFDDLYTLFAGGDSLIGRLIDELFGVGASKRFVHEVKESVVQLWDRLKETLPTIMKVKDALTNAWQTSKDELRRLLRLVESFLQALKLTAEVTLDVKAGKWEQAIKDINNSEAWTNFKKGVFGEAEKGAPGGQVNGGESGIGPDGFVPAPFVPSNDRGFGETAMPAPPSMIFKTEAHVNVQGGATNEETGRTVAKATTDAVEATHRKAAAAVRAQGVRGVAGAPQ